MRRLPWGAGATELREFSGKQWTRRGFSGGSGDLWVPGQAAAGKPSTHELLTQQNCFHGIQQFNGSIRIRDVARCTSAQGFACNRGIVVSG